VPSVEGSKIGLEANIFSNQLAKSNRKINSILFSAHRKFIDGQYNGFRVQ
jgi:hypothetical protein